MGPAKIVKSQSSSHGAKKENIFLALDAGGNTIGSALLYPYYDDLLEPEHPHNIYLGMYSTRNQTLSEADRDALLDKALQRGGEIKRQAGQSKTRLYTCFLKDQQEDMGYYLARGFVQDESMLILERPLGGELSPADPPPGIRLTAWMMDEPAQREQFIATHQEVFPRHPYSQERLLELKSYPGWDNRSAFQGDRLCGNIMFYTDPEASCCGIIEDLFVAAGWRRQRIGSCLLAAALQDLKASGMERVQLEMWSANKPAHQLYQHFGFKPIDATEFALGRYI